MISADLIERRINNFWGYGSLEAPFWFVGMEEGLSVEEGPRTETELKKRFRATDGKITVDMRPDMVRVRDHMEWFRPGASIQKTWLFPIALYLYLTTHRRPTTEEIRKFQISELGDAEKKQTSVLDLMPLPSPNVKEWWYKQCNIVGLSSRREYCLKYGLTRVQKLGELIQTNCPTIVIFMSVEKSLFPLWTSVIGRTPELVLDNMYFIKTYQTAFCVLPRGASGLILYERLYRYADMIRRRITFRRAARRSS